MPVRQRPEVQALSRGVASGKSDATAITRACVTLSPGARLADLDCPVARMPAEDYTATEVAWLLSIDYEAALACDADPPDSFPDLVSSNYHSGSSGTADDRPVLVVLRWNDVHRALGRVNGLIDHEVLELRLDGLTEHQIGVVLGRSRQTIGRQFDASIEEILRELGVPLP
jgi:hypothetical protein